MHIRDDVVSIIQECVLTGGWNTSSKKVHLYRFSLHVCINTHICIYRMMWIRRPVGRKEVAKCA